MHEGSQHRTASRSFQPHCPGASRHASRLPQAEAPRTSAAAAATAALTPTVRERTSTQPGVHQRLGTGLPFGRLHQPDRLRRNPFRRRRAKSRTKRRRLSLEVYLGGEPLRPSSGERVNQTAQGTAASLIRVAARPVAARRRSQPITHPPSRGTAMGAAPRSRRELSRERRTHERTRRTGRPGCVLPSLSHAQAVETTARSARDRPRAGRTRRRRAAPAACRTSRRPDGASRQSPGQL